MRGAEGFEWGGEGWVADAERVLYRERNRTLYVADLHLGKAETFRRSAIPVPHGSTRTAIERLAGTVERHGARRVVLLGDLWHAKAGVTQDVLRPWTDWVCRFGGEVALVPGNHDRRAGNWSEECGMRLLGHGSQDEGIELRHEPGGEAGTPWLAGHLHPGVVLTGPGGVAKRLACFWIRPEGIVLPAFGEFTGLATVGVRSSDRVLTVTDEGLFWSRR